VLGPATSAYVPMKYWIADRTGTIRVKFSAFIVSGPYYWAYQFRKNASSVLANGHYNSTLESGYGSDVHSYTTFTNTLSGLNPGDCITYEMASANSGGSPTTGSGTQCLYVKELRFLSNSPSISNNITNNVFGEWVGIGTSCPVSNLYINGNNPALYDATVDSGQDGCGVTTTIRNNSTVTNSFAQLNLQVSGDSGRAVGRIALIRRDSATADMAFVTENANTKSEKMRITAGGNLLIGITSNYAYQGGALLHIRCEQNTGTNIAIQNQANNSSAAAHVIFGTYGNGWSIGMGSSTSSSGNSFYFSPDPSAALSKVATLSTGGVWSTSGGGTSDRRTKQNIEYIENNGINYINLLKPAKFKFKLNPNNVRRGFIAQDVLEVIPDLVLGDGDKEAGIYGLDYDGVLALTVKAIQEQQCTINTLKSCLGIS
jgi:hypothetical protein